MPSVSYHVPLDVPLASSTTGSAAAPRPRDREVGVGDLTLLVEEGLEGLLDVEEPHDRLVLRPAGSTPHVRGEHG